jgi:hypothetical protein
MLSAILALVTTAALAGQEQPIMVEPFKTVDACMIAAYKSNVEHSKELADKGAAFACLVVKFPNI